MMSTTPKSEYSELVESDKRSVLEKVMRNANLLEHCSGVFKSQPLNMKDRNENIPTYSIKSMREEIDSILAEDDDEDIDEAWNKILVNAEEAFKREQLFKEKHPYLESFQEKSLKPARTRKRKSTFETNTRNLIDSFKKDFTGEQHNELSLSGTDSSLQKAQTMKKLKKEETVESRFFKCKLTKDNPVPSTCVPKWKTTTTGTAIFDLPYNPNWENIKENACKNDEKNETASQTSQASSKLNFQKLTSSSSQKKSTSTEESKKVQRQDETNNKLYTPGHIKNWMGEDKSTDEMVAPSSCKSFRSDAATYHSTEFDNISELSYGDFSSTPTRNTTVRFRASPPQRISYSPRPASVISNDYYQEQNVNYGNGGPSFDFQFNSNDEYDPTNQYDNHSILSLDSDINRSQYMEDYPLEHTDKENIPSPKFLSRQAYEENFARLLNAKFNANGKGLRNVEIEYNTVKSSVRMKYF